MKTQARWSHEARFAPGPGSASAARIFVARYLVKHELAYLVDDVRLVASELVSNAAVHAGTPMLVTLEELPPCVRLSVQDEDPKGPTMRIPRQGEPGGRGLRVVSRFSTEWGVTRGPNGGKTVWASFALRTGH